MNFNDGVLQRSYYFNFIGGVPNELVYDNMRVAVANFVGNTEKTPTQGLTNLSNWYNFSFRFCNAAKGNEKGHVERSVEYLRRKVFMVKDTFDSLEEANAYFRSGCVRLNQLKTKEKKQTISENFSEEKDHLLAHGQSFPCCTTTMAKVDKYSTISYTTNRYSIPDHLVGKLVELRVYVHKIKVLYQNKEVCVHSRAYTKHQWYLDIGHYLKTLSRKPGALSGSVAFKQMETFYMEVYQNYFKETPKDFIVLLDYQKEQKISTQQLKTYIHTLLKSTLSVSSDKVKILHQKSLETTVTKSTVSDPTSSEVESRCREQLEAISQMMKNTNPINQGRC